MEPTGNVRFERKTVAWILDSLLMLAALGLFVLSFPKHGFDSSNKISIYWFFALLVLFLLPFYRSFVRPYALRFTPDGLLVVQSLLFSKRLAGLDLEALIIHEVLEGKKSKLALTLEVKNGDSMELPDLGPLSTLIERLSALNPQLTVRDLRTPPRS